MPGIIIPIGYTMAALYHFGPSGVKRPLYLLAGLSDQLLV